MLETAKRMASQSEIEQAISLINSGLSFRMNMMAREWAEDALWLIKNQRLEPGIDALCQSIGMCEEPVALHHLTEARNLLAPDRIASS